MQDIFLEMSETINLVGQDKVINLLKKARENVCNPIHIKNIFSIVCEVFELNVKHINELKAKTDERLLVIALCVFYSRKKINCTYEEINLGLITNLSKRTYERYFDIIKNANLKKPKSAIDKSIAKNNTTLNEKINEYFKSKK